LQSSSRASCGAISALDNGGASRVGFASGHLNQIQPWKVEPVETRKQVLAGWARFALFTLWNRGPVVPLIRHQLEECMADNLKELTLQDARRISLSEEWEVRYWTKALGISRERRTGLVDQHGNSAKAVREVLGRS